MNECSNGNAIYGTAAEAISQLEGRQGAAIGSSKMAAASHYGFDNALRILKRGGRVAREGWNGRDQYVFLVSGEDDSIPHERAAHLNAIPSHLFHGRRGGVEARTVGGGVRVMPHLRIHTTQGYVASWVPSITDLLAEDWLAL